MEIFKVFYGRMIDYKNMNDTIESNNWRIDYIGKSGMCYVFEITPGKYILVFVVCYLSEDAVSLEKKLTTSVCDMSISEDIVMLHTANSQYTFQVDEWLDVLTPSKQRTRMEKAAIMIFNEM